MPRHWSEIEPRDAVDITLPRDDIVGPINELGEPCPWPWDPQQLVGAPLGQYHCPYCGGMQVAGIPHLDWTGQLHEPPAATPPHKLWAQAEAERIAAGQTIAWRVARYAELMTEAGHLVPADHPDAEPPSLPCGWPGSTQDGGQP